MRAEILKSGVWLPLNWRIGKDTEVVEEMNLAQLFDFVAPYARMQIFDVNDEFRPGGTKEIIRGDEVRIFGGETDSIEILRGTVDLGVEWSPRDSLVNINVLGPYARLKDVKLGRVSTTGGVGPDPNNRLYRYRKVVQEVVDGETSDYEYIALPSTYEDVWADLPGEQLGYEKIWLFDSLPDVQGAPFNSESQQYPIYSIYDADGNSLPLGVYRRRLVVGTPTDVTVENIMAEIVKQVSLQTGKVYNAVTSIAPFTIPIKAHLVESKFETVDWFLAPDGELYAFGWEEDYGHAKIARIVNGADWQGVLDVDFVSDSIRPFTDVSYWDQVDEIARIEAAMGGASAEWVDGGPKSESGWFLWGLDGRQSILFYRGSESVIRIVNHSHGQLASDPFIRVAHFAYQIIDTDTWTILTGGTIGDTEYPLNPEPTSWKSIAPDEGGDVQLSYQVREHQASLTRNGIQYSIINGVPFITGDLAIDRIGFAFKDVSIAEVLKQIAILTGSRLNVVTNPDGSNTIYLVSRDYHKSEFDLKTLDCIMPGTSLKVQSFWGQRTPKISSAILKNEGYNQALANYYRDAYFPDEQETWTLPLIETDETAAIRLLDGVIEDHMRGQSINGGFATVEKMTIRGGFISLQATRVRP